MSFLIPVLGAGLLDPCHTSGPVPPRTLPSCSPALARGSDTVRWVGTGSFARLPVSQWVRQ